MEQNISIVIACLDDPDIRGTVENLLATAPGSDIIVVDDYSVHPVAARLAGINGVRVIRNDMRCGCGPSRHIGVLAAKHQWVLILDPHMRCEPGFRELFFALDERMLYCGSCVPYHNSNWPPKVSTFPAIPSYEGGHLAILGNTYDRTFDAVWNTHNVPDGGIIGCCLGACYLFHRETFLRLSPLRLLRQWGSDEVMMSLKYWLGAAGVTLLKNFRVAHRFWSNSAMQPYRVTDGYDTWNKIFAAYTLLPMDLAERVKNRISVCCTPHEFKLASDLWKHDWHIVQTERAQNQAMFIDDFDSYMALFGIKLPA